MSVVYATKFGFSMKPVRTTPKNQHAEQLYYFLELFYVGFLFVFTYVLFVALGPENFADYSAYENFKLGEQYHDFLFEFLTRTILSYGGSFLPGFNNADNLIMFCGIWTAGFFLCAINGSRNLLHAFAIFSSFYFPFILTTGLRVSPAYTYFFFVFYWLNINKISLNRAILFMLPASMLFHDSVLIVLAFLVGIKIINLGRISERNLPKFLLAWSLFFILAKQLVPIQPLIDLAEVFLGARSGYVGAEAGTGYAVSLYFSAIWVFAVYAYRDSSVSNEVKLITLAFLFCSCFLSNIAPVAAIRLSHFLLIMIIASRANLFGRWELHPGYNLLSFPIYSGIYTIQFFGVLVR